ncbi:MAG: hypothetical protein HY293_18040 [Planctomycetes bacterium]|nr:hypothetical protein [Planctomycetota bacterium]
METREYQGPTWRGRRFLVRWVDVPGLCDACGRSLEIRRYIADVLCNVPFVVFFILLVGFDSKVFLALLLGYALVLFKWSWGLGYVWADALVYGRDLDSRLARFEPPGDGGTTRFPAGLWHCLLRLGLLPGLAVMLLLVMAPFAHLAGAGTPKTPPPAASQSSDPIEQARAWFQSARDIVVPVDPSTLAMMRMDVKREDVYFFQAYAKPEDLPRGSSYQRMTGPQLLDSFIRSSSMNTDILFVQGSPLKGISRGDAATIASGLPAATPPDPKVQQGR